ncbi:histone deacetylase 15 isoform X2 [Rhododendron vialii]|uniref:histone deacetylase 15 isoform X2 n=1 Tax=Rhododendron vialii TaxID=182163 RepID=UPI00265F1184|nr:histone deacetylase 15 isoform X2 [Rhododendron vialii]
MDLEALPMSCLKNGEAEHNPYTQHRVLGSECECDSRRNRDLGSVGINISPCQGGNCGEERVSTAPISVRDRAEDMVANIKPDVKSKKARQQKKMTLEDMYNNQYDFDDEDDDSDWEPVQKPAAVVKWFCVNCTMVNLGDDSHCDICGEHKESGILKHGYFASPFLKEAGLSQNELEVKERYKGKFTAVGFDERMLLHSEVEMKSHPHPERPDRLRAITASLATAGIFPGRCFPISAREITEEELHMVHSLEHIQSVELTSQLLASYFTPDTYANEHSARAARLAAGLCADLASEILSGHAKNGFALVRPPGHHAGIRQAMGFCLHNNAAVAALAAQGVGAKRVLIVDWDVHHGNGTQEIFDGSKTVLYVSLHRHEGGKFYPGTGAAHEVGSMGAEGYCVNVPWSRGGVGDNDYLFAFQHVVLPIASAFSPDFIIISAGFDAARGDPLGCCDVTPSGFAQMTHALNAISGGKLLVILEGGYNLRSISSSATAVIKVLLGESPGCEAENAVPSKSGLLTVMEVLKIQMKFWPTLEPVLLKLNLQWGTYALPNRSESEKKETAGWSAGMVAVGAKTVAVSSLIRGPSCKIEGCLSNVCVIFSCILIFFLLGNLIVVCIDVS